MTSTMNGSGACGRCWRKPGRNSASRGKLTVLSNQVDPYRFDTPAGHRDGAWLAEQLDRAIGAHRRIHWRGLHYAIVAAGDIRKPSGEIYRNNYVRLDMARRQCRQAAVLSHIDFERIVDNRNAEPIIHRKARVEPETWISVRLEVSIPDVDDLEPDADVTGF